MNLYTNWLPPMRRESYTEIDSGVKFMYFCEADYNALLNENKWRIKQIRVDQSTWDFLSERYSGIQFNEKATDLDYVKALDYISN